jgi:hypothetical protein
MRPDLVRRRLRRWIRGVIRGVGINTSPRRRCMIPPRVIHLRVPLRSVIDDRLLLIVSAQPGRGADAAAAVGRARAREGAVRRGLLDGGRVRGPRAAAPPEPADAGARGVLVGGRGPVAAVAHVPAAEPDLHEGADEEDEAGLCQPAPTVLPLRTHIPRMATA